MKNIFVIGYQKSLVDQKKKNKEKKVDKIKIKKDCS